MKVFYVVLAILVVVLCGITYNAARVHRVVAGMLERLEETTEEVGEARPEELAAFREAWEAQVDFLGLTVGRATLNRVSEEARRMEAAVRSGDEYGYLASRALLREALEEVARLERPFFDCTLIVGELFAPPRRPVRTSSM